MVDFDLEAPGLNTFNLPRETKQTRGIVDYVLYYLRNNKPDSIEGYIYECVGEAEKGGGLWVMPAGSEKESYAADFNSIDWGVLYSQYDGILPIENLKVQVAKDLQPDYILIDSRTGHTDIAGSCTRQLPDAVVALFFPTAQNLVGLENIVNNIRSEPSRSGRSEIKIHFVTANVPDIDDENKILADRMNHFSSVLGYNAIASTIHHYPSLDLLNQEVFVSKHPNSRLSKEYLDLMRAVRENPEDREGALAYLKNIYRYPGKVARAAHNENIDENR